MNDLLVHTLKHVALAKRFIFFVVDLFGFDRVIFYIPSRSLLISCLLHRMAVIIKPNYIMSVMFDEYPSVAIGL